MPRSIPSPFPSLVAALGAVACCAGGLAAQREWLDTLPPEQDASTLAEDTFSLVLDPVTLPGEGPLRGLAWRDGLVWLARGDALVVFDPADGRVVRQRTLSEDDGALLALTADDRFVYALRERAVEVLDPLAMQAVRELALPKHESGVAPRAAARHGDRLFVAWPDRLVAIDVQSGEARDVDGPEKGCVWLASDGPSLWCGLRESAFPLGLGDEARSDGRELYWFGGSPRSAAAWVGGRLLLAVEERAQNRETIVHAGYVRADAPPVRGEMVSVKIHRKDRTTLHYEVGPKPLEDLAGVQRELKRIAQDPSCRVRLPDGTLGVLPAVLEPYPGVTVGELAATWDVVRAAGFEEVWSPTAELARRRAAERPADTKR